MTKLFAGVFALGVALIIAGGVTQGFDATTVVLLVLALGVAAMGLAVARRFSSGKVAPAQCAQCGGLVAPSSPYCKHCGAPR